MVDPCTLVTAADVSAVVGATVPPSTSEFTGTYQSCAYNTPEDSAGGSQVVNVTDRLIDKAGFEARIKQDPGAIAPLPNVCQDAYKAGSDVLAWKNGTEVDALLVGTPAGHDAVAEGTKLVTGACAEALTGSNGGRPANDQLHQLGGAVGGALDAIAGQWATARSPDAISGHDNVIAQCRHQRAVAALAQVGGHTQHSRELVVRLESGREGDEGGGLETDGERVVEGQRPSSDDRRRCAHAPRR